MASYSIWHWFIVLIILLVTIGIPAWFGMKIARRARFAPASGLLVGVPIVGLVMLWIWAFRSWPSLEDPLLSPATGRQG